MSIKFYSLYIYILLFGVTVSHSQTVHWASEVIEFSSEKKSNHHLHHLHPRAHKAIQVLDEPNIMPNSKSILHAWIPQKANGIDYIKVKFDTAIYAKQIIIAEVISPSAISELYLYDNNGREYFIKSFNPKPIPLTNRLFRVLIEKTPYPVMALKLVLNGRKVPGYNGIDAIGISDSDESIEIKPNIAEGFQHAHQSIRLSDSVNTKFKELKPVLSPDGNRMYFSRINYPHNIGGRKDAEDIWFSDYDSIHDEWMKAQNLGAPLNNKGPNFICSITPRNYYYDLLLGNYYKGNKMIAGLSIASRHEFGYTDPEPVIIENDENLSQYANYFLSNNEQAILMSVQRTGGYGDRDLYVTFRQKNGRWSTPLNLGDVVNTADAEASPFLAMDNKTLYFSSEGHLGYGEEDIFVTHRLDSTWTNWSEPENLGSAVNSEEDDIFFNLSPNNKYAYFSRGNIDNTDIYRMELPLFQLPDPVIVLKGRVLDGQTMKPVPNTLIQFRDTKQRLTVSQLRAEKQNGSFQVVLPINTNYRLFAYSDNLISSEAEMLEAEYIYETDTVYRDILLYPTKDGKPVLLNGLLTGKVTNGNTGEPMGNVKIIFKDLRNNTVLDIITTEKLTGNYKTKLPVGSLYNISIQSENYVSVENEIVDLSNEYENDTIIHDFKLFPLEIGQRISLNNVYFDLNKATLRKASITQLQQIKLLMQENPKIKIQVDGHTCSIGQADYNQKLSEDRAQAVFQYLVEVGINSERMSSFGFGETKPLVDERSSDAIEMNRRVEFIILDM
ncbi:MAG: OmpA family protein [Cyclobacteriaceae bacterium]|nr:OmpA family protein [Cyclobacteriaceae bacterium]